MDHSAIKSQLPAIVVSHVPRNSRGFKFRVYDDQPAFSTMGFRVDPKPFQGKVIAVTDEAIVIKVGRIDFAVVDRGLATVVPHDGAKVEVIPYARRRFDGMRLDTPEEETRYTGDGEAYTTRSIILGGATLKLPVPKAQCPQLADLIEQLEHLPAPDGLRGITHLLVDAGACDFETVDPAPANIIKTPPAIAFTVSSAKFQGRVTVLYERGPDLYAVELRQHGELVKRTDDIGFESLGDVLDSLIDDGQWRRIRVDVLDGKSKRTLH
ncbi:MAG TPA: GTPase [Spongiibacteraceae bacterium]|nr:GTPase [Spongiibacteraceae bacterium]